MSVKFVLILILGVAMNYFNQLAEDIKCGNYIDINKTSYKNIL